MNHASGSTVSPFATRLIPAGFDDLLPRTEDDANGNRDSTGYTVGTGGTLTASPNATYTYDSAGHLTAKTDTSTGKVTTFAYDHRDRLTGITRKTSGGTVDYRTTYVYDALNRRIAEQVDADGAGAGSPVTTWTVFDGENPYADFNGAGSLQTRYLYSLAVDEILGRTDSSGDTYWYMTDGLGSVRDIFDEWGSSAYHTGYDSFGSKISTTGTGDRFGFTGREHDAALNLYYYRARFYDPATGRFLSKDPIGFEAGDTNLYRYVGNGPQNGTDPTGLDWLDSSANFFAGMGDALSFGITDLAREITGINDGIDHGSIEYVGGIVAGTGLGVAIIGAAPKAPPAGVGKGKLTPSEFDEIQDIADKFMTIIDVVGSRASGDGRNIDTSLPIGKGPGTRSDIDFRIDTQHPNLDELISDLKEVGGGAGSASPEFGIDHRPTYPPFIRFRPKKWK